MVVFTSFPLPKFCSVVLTCFFLFCCAGFGWEKVAFLPRSLQDSVRNALEGVSLGFLWEFDTSLLDSVFSFHLTRSLFNLTYKSKWNSLEFMRSEHTS